MKRLILIGMLCSMLMGCGGRHFVHNTLTQGQVNQVHFDCQYRAEMMSHRYSDPFVAAMDKYENFGNCMRANGFVEMKK